MHRRVEGSTSWLLYEQLDCAPTRNVVLPRTVRSATDTAATVSVPPWSEHLAVTSPVESMVASIVSERLHVTAVETPGWRRTTR
jgi:hypothetical protein